MAKRNRRITGDQVYSPADGWVPDPDRQPASAAPAPGSGPADATAARVLVGRETKGRKGNGVTTIDGLTGSEAALTELARSLKRACATGGTLRGDVIELQGDCRDAVLNELRRRGFDAKRSGG
jgi:translation initiation factor 1